MATCVSRVTAVREMTVAFESGDKKRSDRIADFIRRSDALGADGGAYLSLLPLGREDKALFGKALRVYTQPHGEGRA